MANLEALCEPQKEFFDIAEATVLNSYGNPAAVHTNNQKVLSDELAPLAYLADKLESVYRNESSLTIDEIVSNAGHLRTGGYRVGSALNAWFNLLNDTGRLHSTKLEALVWLKRLKQEEIDNIVEAYLLEELASSQELKPGQYIMSEEEVATEKDFPTLYDFSYRLEELHTRRNVTPPTARTIAHGGLLTVIVLREIKATQERDEFVRQMGQAFSPDTESPSQPGA